MRGREHEFRVKVQAARSKDKLLQAKLHKVSMRARAVGAWKSSMGAWKRKQQRLLEESAVEKEKLQRQLARLQESSVKWHTQHFSASVCDGSDFAIVPVEKIPIRVAKFDVVLREEPLRAAHAMHTILTRMVKFRCLVCNERFPSFHPAYVPPADLNLEVLKRGRSGTASCNMEVAIWTEAPPLCLSEEAKDGLAHQCTGHVPFLSYGYHATAWP